MNVPDRPGYWIMLIKYPAWVFTTVKYVSNGRGQIVGSNHIGGIGPNPRTHWVGPFETEADAENMLGTP